MHYTVDDLRRLWLEFWETKNHAIIPSSSVIPENDPTALFHNSGMHPLVPYLMGEKHPKGVRLANVQKCIRTGDIEEAGDTTHLTFFEMLGNWSLGDFFKKEQIAWSFEFLTQVLNIPLERLAVSVFEGDAQAPRDSQAAEIWEKAGIPKDKIAYLDANENWWAKGETGPCGPDTEMFYWRGDLDDPILKKPYQETWENPLWIEIWNDVFMEFNKLPNGSLENLPSQNVDTGMGLERTVAVLNGKTSVYETSAFTPILEAIAEIAQKPDIAQDPIGTQDHQHSGRIIADHIRSSSVIIADGIKPSNVDQGYILRRLIRRAVRHGRNIGVEENLCSRVGLSVINNIGGHYKEIKEKQSLILDVLEKEEQQFRKTLEKGEKEFEKMVKKVSQKITGEMAFNLYQTYGFPIEITEELAQERGLEVDKKGFENYFSEHQEKARTAAKGKFQGGLSRENIEAETQLHTATHLLLAGLRLVLGDHVHQAGSNITSERLRFDFTHGEKMTDEEKSAVESYVNESIKADAEQILESVPRDEAQKDSSIEASFWEKYPDMVKVYTFKDKTGKVWSRELCGGPHMKSTGEIKGQFRIKKEESSSQGVRRIKAILV